MRESVRVIYQGHSQGYQHPYEVHQALTGAAYGQAKGA
jgi:hypothetical protein